MTFFSGGGNVLTLRQLLHLQDIVCINNSDMVPLIVKQTKAVMLRGMPSLRCASVSGEGDYWRLTICTRFVHRDG